MAMYSLSMPFNFIHHMLQYMLLANLDHCCNTTTRNYVSFSPPFFTFPIFILNNGDDNLAIIRF